jgi:dihydrofolate reductase
MSPAPARRPAGMTDSKVVAQISMSLDGFVAGPDQNAEQGLGAGGEALHEWMFAPEPHPVDAAMVGAFNEPFGAHIMGRNMFGPIRGPWSSAPEWRGWWGEDPPFGIPVFVLTHHAREPLTLGRTTFTFVTDGLDAALALAREAAQAAGKDVSIAGGAQAINQALRAGGVDELFLHIVPLVLGDGERLLTGIGSPRLEIIETIASPAVTHVRYRVGR